MVNNITKLLIDTLETADKINKHIKQSLAFRNFSRPEFKKKVNVNYSGKIKLLDPEQFDSENEMQNILDTIDYLHISLKK